MPKKCCVSGCLGASRLFTFPNAITETDRFLKWLAASGNRELLNNTSAKMRNRYVCLIHFEPKYVLAKKLSTTAVPTLNLPEKIDVSPYTDIVSENTTPAQHLSAGTLKAQGKPLQGCRTQLITLKRREIFLNMQKHLAADFQKRIEHLEHELFEKSKCAIVIDQHTKRNLSRLFSVMRTKWKESGRKVKNFLDENQEWLDVVVVFTGDSKPNQASICGHPSLDFAASSERSKRRKTEELRESHAPEELWHAAQMSLRTSGDLDSSKMIKDAITPAPASTLSRTEYTPLSMDEALSVIVEAKLTRHQFNIIRNSMKDHNCYLYPSYEAILEATALCSPPQDSRR